MGLTLLMCLGIAVVLSGCGSMLVGDGVRAPVGDSLRAGRYVATLMSSLQGRIPELHRNPENDRYRLSLMLTPVDGGSPKIIELARELKLSDFTHQARLLGDDGKMLWFHAHEPMGYDYHSYRLIRQNLLPRTGEPFRPMSFSSMAPERFLSPAKEYASRYVKPRIVLEEKGFKPLKPGDPDGVLLVSLSKAGLFGTYQVSRMGTDGKELWMANTNIQHLQQVLPARDAVVFIGKLLEKQKDEVRGPTMVIVDTGTGKLVTQSLWVP